MTPADRRRAIAQRIFDIIDSEGWDQEDAAFVYQLIEDDKVIDDLLTDPPTEPRRGSVLELKEWAAIEDAAPSWEDENGTLHNEALEDAVLAFKEAVRRLEREEVATMSEETSDPHVAVCGCCESQLMCDMCPGIGCPDFRQLVGRK